MRLRWVVGVVLGVSAACGGGDGDGAGVDGQKLLLDISDGDAVALCMYARSVSGDLYPSAEAFCTYWADDSDAQDCAEERQQCLDDGEFDTYSASYAEGCGAAKAEYIVGELKPECEVTVAEYEACLRRVFQLQRAAVKSAQCDGNYSAAEEAEFAEEETPSAVCEALADCYAEDP